LKEYFTGLDYYFLCQFSWASANGSALLAMQVSKINFTSSQTYDYNHLMWLQSAIGNISNEIRENMLGDFIKHLT
jgi:hypothetical protein